MKALLVHQGLDDALLAEETSFAGETKEQKTKSLNKAHRALILCLGDEVLREVSHEKTAAATRNKLEKLYKAKFRGQQTLHEATALHI